MTIDEIVKAFSSIKKGTFPLKALNEAIDKQEEITPFLLDYIQKTPAEIDADFSKALSEDHASYYWDFSMHLLAQFKESTAFPHIVNFYTHKDQEMVDVVSGDFTTERLPAVLASTFNGDVETLFSVFDDQDIDAFVRGSFLRASIILVLHDVLDHEEMRDRYISLFKQGIEANDYDIVSRLVAELCDLGDPMLRPYIDEAFTKDLVETFIMDKASVDRAYKKPLTKENHFYKLVTDTHAELKGWVWFREEEELSRFKPSTLDAPLVDSFNDQLPLFSNERPAPVVRGSPKVGRNDPCPCGSGKKYKKCCLH